MLVAAISAPFGKELLLTFEEIDTQVGVLEDQAFRFEGGAASFCEKTDGALIAALVGGAVAQHAFEEFVLLFGPEERVGLRAAEGGFDFLIAADGAHHEPLRESGLLGERQEKLIVAVLGAVDPEGKHGFPFGFAFAGQQDDPGTEAVGGGILAGGGFPGGSARSGGTVRIGRGTFGHGEWFRLRVWGMGSAADGREAG